MKKLNKLLVILVSLFVFNINTLAVEEKENLCESSEKVDLGKKAVSVKVSYEEAEGKSAPGVNYPPEGYKGDPKDYVLEYNYFIVTFMNITPEIFVKVTNNLNDKVETINYDDTKDGTYKIEWYGVNQNITYTYKIYGSKKTHCPEIELKKGILSLPVYNNYYDYSICDGHEDYYLCKKYINSPVSYEEFMIKMNKYIKKEEAKEKKEEQKKEQHGILETVKEYYNKNKKTILILGSIVAVCLVALIIIEIRKIRKRVI